MKHLYLILVFICLGCKTQTIVPLYNANFDQSDVYYKDTYNDFDKLAGTWKYSNGTTSLTIVLQKRLKHPVKEYGLNYDMDFIAGGYKYIEDGVEKINTIPQLTENLDLWYYYHIEGNSIVGPKSGYCLNCGPDDRVFLLGFSDPTRDIPGYEPLMFFKRVDSGGVQKLKLDFITISGGWEEEGVDPGFTQYTIPFGTYILIKQ